MESETREGRGRRIARWVLGVAYLLAGISHITSPEGFVRITPNWVPWPDEIVLFTGICEVAGAIALLFIPKLHRAAGWAFAAYAVCVYPANINHALLSAELGPAIGWWYHGPRLLLQPVIVWWALWATRIVDWPFRQR